MPYYITTPIYYPSAPPHLGHLYTSIIVDVISRFRRLNHEEVLFLTGTDEHGLKIENAAKKLGKTPKDFCDEISKSFLNLSQIGNLSNDDFIRTTEERHHKAVAAIWNKINEKGDIYLSKYKGWYSVSDEAYYSEDETELINGKRFSIASKTLCEWFEEDSYFFKLSKYGDRLLELYNKKDFIIPESRKNEIISFVESGLKDLCISRANLKWGVKVPNEPNHVVYVWMDALTNYLSALDYPNIRSDKYSKFWPPVHVVGKDITRFHCVYWPAFLMSAEIECPKKIVSHGWILSNEGEKMSKSKGNILDPNDLVKNFTLDGIRYYLIRETNLALDGKISESILVNKINADLSNNLGNLCQRSITFLHKHFEGVLPNKILINGDEDRLLSEFEYILQNSIKSIELYDLQKYVTEIWEKIGGVNSYFTKLEPWTLINHDKERTHQVLYVVMEALRNIAILSQPIIPDSSKKILDMLSVSNNNRSFSNIGIKSRLQVDTKIKEPKIIFPRIEV